MGTFKLLPHTADAGFTARGASLSDLFETAAKAMFSIEYDLSTVAFRNEALVEESADDFEELLAAWLSRLLWLHDAENFAPGDFVISEIGESPHPRPGARRLSVRGAARGAVLGDWFEQTGPQIKAVTLHGLQVRPLRRGYEATVYVDV